MKRWICLLTACVLLTFLLPAQANAAELDVAAKSAVLMDAATGTVLYEKDPHLPLHPASVTKVMTLLLIMEAIESGRIRWEDPVTASEAAAAKGGSQVYLKVGEVMSVTDMVKAIAVSSANDCACAMAEHIAGSENAFVELMNRRAGELGMADTHFINCTGLDDDPTAKEHLTSAYDIALMSRQLLTAHPKIKEFTTIWMDTLRNGTFGLSNTNKLIRFYRGATGLKTGFTSAAGYCLSAAAQREDMELIAVVMGSSTSQDRFAACKSMLDYGFANYALIVPSTGPLCVPVKLGKQETVSAIPGEASPLLVDKGQKSQIRSDIVLEPSVMAPVSQGQRLGTMTLKAGEQILAEVPLVAEVTVPRLTFWDVYLQLLRRVAMAEPA